jgi:acetyl-CoA C-acetyltransferase
MTGQAFIYDAIRTPRGKGKADGKLYEVKPVALLSQQLQRLAERQNLDTKVIQDLVIGCVSAVGEQGMNIAKTAAMHAQWSQDVAGVTLNRFCASGLEAINLAAAKVASPDTNLRAGFMPQGIGADLIATLEGFTREDIDAFALRSHMRAADARAQGRFKSVIPVVDQNNLPLLTADEMIRPETSMEALGQLKASFGKIGEMGFQNVAYQRYPAVEKIHYVHTAGNSSGISDGASVALIGTEAAGKLYKLTPRARIVATAAVGSEPTIMLTGPAPATQLALKKAKLRMEDIDLFEVNEAFASVVLKFQKDTGVPFEKINVNGGAIAMGHPLGATGAMLCSSLIDELELRGLRYGVVTLCIGAGMGIATVIERL